MQGRQQDTESTETSWSTIASCTQLVLKKHLPPKRQPGVEGRAVGFSTTVTVRDLR